MNYKVYAGFYRVDIRDAEFSNVIEAMDFADLLFEEGFDYIEVVDSDRKLVYSVEQVLPMTPGEREARRLKSIEFSVKWNHKRRMESMTAKQSQDAAYETYKTNIQYSHDMDAIMGYFHKRNENFPTVPAVLKAFN